MYARGYSRDRRRRRRRRSLNNFADSDIHTYTPHAVGGSLCTCAAAVVAYTRRRRGRGVVATAANVQSVGGDVSTGSRPMSARGARETAGERAASDVSIVLHSP